MYNSFKLIILGLILIPVLVQASKNIDVLNRCDKLFADSHYTDIALKDYPECKNRWIWNVNRDTKGRLLFLKNQK